MRQVILNTEQLNKLAKLEEIYCGLKTGNDEGPANKDVTVSDGRFGGDDAGVNDKSDPVTTDKIADELSSHNGIYNCGGYYTNRKGICTMCEEDEELNEENKDLKYMNFTVNYGDNNIERGNEDCLSTKMSKAKKMGDKNTYTAIKKSLDLQRNIVKNAKKIKKDVLGWANQFQRAGGKKNNLNGKAHTPKKNGIAKITYFE